MVWKFGTIVPIMEDLSSILVTQNKPFSPTLYIQNKSELRKAIEFDTLIFILELGRGRGSGAVDEGI